MWRAVAIFIAIAIFAAGLAWFADRPGSLTLTWLGYEVRTTFLFALAAIALLMVLLLMVWSVIRWMIGIPGSVSGFFRTRRRQKGFDALGQGMIAVGAGDAALASKLSGQADRLIGNEPMALLLRAQAAQINGDEAAAGRIFRAMLQSRETELLGLRGLFIQARRGHDSESAREHAERAMRLKPDLPWAARAVLSLQSADGDWRAAERTLTLAMENRLIGKGDAARQRAVLLTARALAAEDDRPGTALALALEAHRLAPGLVPAGVIAGRTLAAQGNTRKAARVLEKTWKLSPHPDIAEVYGAARTGDSPRDRLKRVRSLAHRRPDSVEGPVAVARAAIDARLWDRAREALQPLLDDRPQSRVCMMMAEIEHGERDDKGRVREWLARAVNAPRDPMWTADGYASGAWAPVSPVSGRLDAFEWKVPVEGIAFHGAAELFEARDEAPADLAAPLTASGPMVGTGEPAALAGEDAGPDAAAIEAEAETAAEAEDAAGAGQPRARSAAGETGPAEPGPVAAGDASAQMAPEPVAGDSIDGSLGDGRERRDAARSAGAGRDGKPLSVKDVTAGRAGEADEPIVFAPPRAPDDPGPEGEPETGGSCGP